ncbi:trehalose synthase [Legionella massiliensis]|uniref:Trehalose synthase n=1 Tax=Legionella massiliensis TaxID=1034943 RepID=A0A078KYM8_9GAMM|nr:alpha-amylase family protein [Legionella massiliensis]CDZ78177.1 trehalose synthase [Legionella massiliensis]CEE13915.1 Alpha-1,4-glucan:maltose-1-phosphate maltosyltransferase [Legionella massiliensis]
MGYHFLTEGNGILACYDMYPTQFRSFNEMSRYLPVLQEMGFNAFWINPIQLPGDISNFYKTDRNNGVKTGNEVTRSLYAMSNPFEFNPLFAMGTVDDLRTLTQTARNHDLVPMFDLVLNHASIDSPLCVEKPHWFKGIHEDFKDVRGFNYDDPEIRTEIIQDLWKPYIRRYMLDYGFDGVRVDAVGYVHSEVRQEIYEYIYQLAKENGKPRPEIIDEALFNKRPLVDEVDYLKLPGVGPTHITTEVYNAEFDLSTTELPPEVLLEEQLKSSVVFRQRAGELREGAKGGCINFCGNHDYRSLAMTILFQMAEKRLKSDPLYKELILDIKLEDPLKTTLVFSYVEQIKEELRDNNEATQKEFRLLVQKKLALTALTGSGGWFILSGDESSDPIAKTVFQRKDASDKSYYPQQEHRYFSEQPILSAQLLAKMAEKSFFIENKEKPWMLALYQRLSTAPAMQQRLLVAHVDNLKNQINAGIQAVQEKFAELMSEEGCSVGFSSQDYHARPRLPENGWLGLQNNFAFIKQLNALLKKLPASVSGFSSILVSLPEKPNLVVVVRKNGEQSTAPIDLVAVNLDQDAEISLSIKDIQQIARIYSNSYSSAWSVAENQKQDLYRGVLSAVAEKRLHGDDTVKLAELNTFTFQDNLLETFFSKDDEAKRSKCNPTQSDEEGLRVGYQ